ncbi:MAG: low-specificity L-threonine aldolase [Candidatus Izemoplasmatales bacterium]|nr:low-specificity L-threonine aldolase [Candidatus Izemoplasmatales bacterium]
MKYIDLRSDTVTKPTKAMYEAMLKAQVGDDVFSDDPTTNELEALCAQMFKKEASLFVPSGTFSNQLALFTHCRQGEEVILDQNAHIVQHESGASAVIAGVQLFMLPGKNGIWNLDDLEKAIKVQSVSTTRTALICLETAFGGSVLPLEYIKAVSEIARKHNLPVHLDGARIFNAAVSLKTDVSEIGKYADSISVCLSKGLASPIGTMLVGSKTFIEQARHKRKLMGGGMRQTGILAACGIVSLSQMSLRLEEDHENARYLATLLRKIPGIVIDESQRDINMVFFDIADERKHYLDRFLYQNGVKILPYEGVFRFVTHNDIDRNDIETAVKLVDDYFNR